MRVLFYVWRFHDSTDGILSEFVKNCNHPSFYRVFSPSFILLSFFQCKFFFPTSQERLGWTWTDLIRLGRIQADSEGPRLMDPNIVLNSFFIKLFHGGHQWECIQTFLLIIFKTILFAGLQ